MANDAGFTKYSVSYYHSGIPFTKFLNRRGLLSLEGALKIQSFFYNLGFRMKDTLVLIAEK